MSKHNLLDEMIAQTKLSKKTTDKQQKIVETAIKMFAEKGYSNTSTSEIAKAAGVAEGTIFRHYGTKDNLLLSVILPFIKEALPTMAENVFNEIMQVHILSFEDFLRALLKNRIEFVNGNKEIFQILVKEVLYKEELRKEIAPYFTENVLSRIIIVIEKYKESGELVELPSNTILRMLFTLIGGYLVSRFVLQTDRSNINEEEEVENIITFIMNGIRK
ncbi:TetR/AcrR family transcriptional regulator [Sutcliffiella halmapala]|uniref:TetR/AcrR family transcriptional regulator n=1 Tax=Sutcliffiella halmapala TaxID=79882 RepID=UPI00099551FC|nr:TetR/AcrR family transcriptional regulator [Sutcliffiella halmapala]